MNKKGFTLIELLVVVLIIGILAAIALPQYFRAVERSRTTEALSLMGTMAAAQERVRLLTGAYTTDLTQLDISFFLQDGSEAAALPYNTANFTINIDDTGDPATSSITATRINSDNVYTISKAIRSGRVTCDSTSGMSCTALGLES